MLGMAYYYTELLYLFMLMCLVFTSITFFGFLYLVIYVCLSASDALGRWLYKIFKEGK